MESIVLQEASASRRLLVAFAHPEKTEKFIHRVVAVKPWGIFTKGDNLAAMEDWILKPGDILGKVKVKNGSFGWEDYSSGEKCPACLTGPSGVPSGFSRTKQACPSSSLPNPPITP